MTAILILYMLVPLSGKSGKNLLVWVWGHQTGHHKMQVAADMYGPKYGCNTDFGTVHNEDKELV